MANPQPSEAAEWDESKYEAALAHLEALQDQIDEARLVIPNMVQSLVVPHAGPEQLFKAFKDTSYNSSLKIGNMRKSWNDPRTRAVLARSRESYRNNKDLSDGQSIPQYDWATRVREAREKQPDDPTTGDAKPEVDESSEDIQKALDDFKATHPGFEVEQQQDNTVIKISIQPSNPPLNFLLSRREDASGQKKFDVECAGDLKLCPAITRCVASRPRPTTFTDLLAMIASYVNARSTKCAKCEKLLNRDGFPPAARRAKESTVDGKTESTWIAYHESCM